MKSLPYLLLTALVLICVPFVPSRADVPPAPRAFDLPAIDAFVAGQVKDKEIVGASLAILRDGQIVFAKGYGQAGLDPQRPVSPETLFGIGSVTKQFTCAAVLLLAEERKLSVYDKVAKYYPDLTRAGDITLYDLMTHRSGYPDYYPLDFVDRRMLQPIGLDKLIADYAKGKLDFEPRTRWSYSNTGYVILGGVIEKVAGEPYERFVERRILEPLGLDHTAFETKDAAAGAQGHTSWALGPARATPPEAHGWLHAAGELKSTPSDLCKWDLALMDGKLLRPESYYLMTTASRLEDGSSTGYACGLSVARRNGVRVLEHSGGVSGFVSQNGMIPARRSAVVFLTNCEEFIATPEIQNRVLELLVPRDGPAEAPERTARRSYIPKIAGEPAGTAARVFFKALQSGKVERGELGEEYSWYLNDARLKEAAERLGPLGEPTGVLVTSRSERGGMEVAVVRFAFSKSHVLAMMYRTPDGKIQEFLIQRG